MFNFDEASQKGREVMDGMLKSYAEVSNVFRAIATEAAEYSKKSYMDGVAHMEALSSVKSPEVALELQANYIRSAYEGALAGMSRIGDMYVDLARTAYKPFEAPVAKKASAKAAAPQATAPAVVEKAQAVSAA